MKKVVKIEARCDNAPYCGAKRHCPVGAIVYDSEVRKIFVDESKCIGCGKCVMHCPHRALSVIDS